MATVSNAGAEIYYECHGDGPALVFAHGRGGNAASWWQQVPRFARDHRVIVFDHRAFGRSRCEPGAFDRALFPAELIRGLSELVPGASCIEIDGAGHSPYFERPDVFNETVAGFLASR